MSYTNYDVELNLSYDYEYRHYIPTYAVAVPSCLTHIGSRGDYSNCKYEAAVSFDEDSEISLQWFWKNYETAFIPSVVWSDAPYFYGNHMYVTPVESERQITKAGLVSKVYFRNPNRSSVTFTSSNCKVKINYLARASFEIQFNSTGFAANQNAWFRCSTVQKNTYEEYSWASATVYYKKSTESTYQSAAGTLSGSWSDVRIDTEIDFEDGYTYDVYITAVSDDGSEASTPVGQFTTTDAAAVSACISPSGAFTSGEVTFVWSHSTIYGTPQYAYDLQYSNNNGSSWTTLKSHEVTSNTTTSATLSDAGVYLWRVRTYNSNDVAGEWAEASFVNNTPVTAPANLVVNTKGRPTVEWASSSQSAYQVQFLLGDSVVYDSGAVYTSETSHFVNQYFNDTRAYTVRLRIYNALGDVSEWVETGYQQPSVADVEFTVEGKNGATITITTTSGFDKYYILRNNKLIGEAAGNEFVDRYAVGLTNYSVVAVTSQDQSDIQTSGYKVEYEHASLITQNGEQILINKRVNNAYEIQTSNSADISKANFLGDALPTHYPSSMRLKSFTVSCFDDQGLIESLLGTMVFYADNFGNGGWCIVTAYDKTDNFIKNGQGVYANEVSLTLEVTNYDDSIEYPL